MNEYYFRFTSIPSFGCPEHAYQSSQPQNILSVTAHKVYHQSESVHRPQTFVWLIPYKGKVRPKHAIKVQRGIGV